MTGSTVVRSSEGATEASDWHHWCRLCAKEHSDNLNVYFRDGDQTWTSVLAIAIGKYFWVNIKMEDELSNMLCKECYTLVEDLVEFSERVSRVQTLFTRLQQAGPEASSNYAAMRKECGLLTDDWKRIRSKNPAVAPNPVGTTTVETAHYVVDDVIEPLDEDAEIMAEIEQSELFGNEAEAYEAYLDNEDDDEDKEDDEEDGEEQQVTAAEEQTSGDNTQPSLDPKPNLLLYDEENQTETKSELKEHAIDEHISYKCATCNKTYKKPMAYKRHMAEVHSLVPNDIPNLECKRCHHFFATENQLTAHYRTHMSAKDKADNACSYCTKLFTTPGALKRHIMGIHENNKPFICDCCGKGMKTITALNEHKLVHTDECPFECGVCHRRFKNKARLKIHSDTHTNNNYECNICGLKLNTRRTLNMHQLVHTDAKQFKCDVCGAAFKRGKTLKSHLILHTGIRPYKCNFCGKDFSNGSNCRMHKRKTHPKELAEEEARGVMRSTLLPMITELTEASKRVKQPAKASTAMVRVKVEEEVTNANLTEDDLDEEAGDEMLYEIVEECP